MASNGAGSSSLQEYIVRTPKVTQKKHHIMRFNANLSIDFSKWTQAKMEREGAVSEVKDEDAPKFGAGSEFGQEQREEARRKKLGFISKKKDPEKPWLLKVGGKTGKKYRSTREGGLGENASFYVFTKAADGAFEAFPVHEWYNFQPLARYKALSAEEAEEQFGKRDQIMNYFSVMMKKRLKQDEGGEDDDEAGQKKGKGKKNKKKDSDAFKISEMDDWVGSSEEGSADSEDEAEQDNALKNKKGKKGVKKKKKKAADSDEEPLEESDDGDEEGRELDYISDTSSSEEETLEEKVLKEEKGVDEEDGLKKLLNSEDEEEEASEEEFKRESENEGEEGDSDTGVKKRKKKKKKKKLKREGSGSEDSGEDSSSKKKHASGSNSSSRAASPTPGGGGKEERSAVTKRAIEAVQTTAAVPPPVKKLKSDSANSQSAYASDINEESVRRYLLRKPMTTTELVQKFKNKKTGLSSEKLVNLIAQILKRINPVKQVVKGKMYLSIKS